MGAVTGGGPRHATLRAMDTAAVREQLEAERSRIVEERQRLQGELQEPWDESSGEIGMDPGDSGTEVLDREIDETLGDATGHVLEQIDRALERLEAGTYGTCEVCGRPIGEERLRALPYATRCIEDEERAEARRRASGLQTGGDPV